MDNQGIADRISCFVSGYLAPGTAMDDRFSRGLHYFTLVLASVTFVLLIAGALVTSHDAGLSVPDWPLSHGQWMPEMSGGVFYEHGHRMIAASVGFLTIILNVWLWKAERRLWVRGLGLVALGSVITQGILGGLTVLFYLPPPISVLHASMAPLFFSMILTLTVVTSRGWEQFTRSLREGFQAISEGSGSELRWAIASSVAVYFQYVLGAAVRHSGTVNGTKGAVLVTSALVSHIVGAVVLVGVVLFASVMIIRRVQEPGVARLAYMKLSLLFVQLFLGFGAYLVRIDPANQVQPTLGRIWVTTSHLAVGALLLATSLILALRLAQQSALRRRGTFPSHGLAEQTL